MKRTGLLASIGFTLLVGLAATRPAAALCTCETYDDFTTSQSWGMGSTCSAADADLYAHVSPEAVANCGGAAKVCSGGLVFTTHCWDPPGSVQFQSDGYLQYSCKVCGIPIP